MTEQNENDKTNIEYRREKFKKRLRLSNELVILEDKCFDYLDEFREYNGNRGLILGEKLKCTDIYEFITKYKKKDNREGYNYKKYKWGYKSVKKDFK